MTKKYIKRQLIMYDLGIVNINNDILPYYENFKNESYGFKEIYDCDKKLIMDIEDFYVGEILPNNKILIFGGSLIFNSFIDIGIFDSFSDISILIESFLEHKLNL